MNDFKLKLHNFTNQLEYFPQTLHLIWQSARWLVIVWALLLILLGVLPALQIYLVKPLIDGMSEISVKGLNDLTGITVPISVLGMTLFFTPILNSLLSWVRSIQAEKVQNSIRRKIQNKAISLDMKHFEDSQYYDKLHRAHVDALSKPIAMLENIGIFFQNSLTLIAILFILFPLGIGLPILLIVSAIPTLYITLKFTLMFHRLRVKNTKNERILNYFDHLMTNNESAAEFKTFNLGNYFKKNYWRLKHTILNGYFKILKSQLIAEMLSATVGFIVVVLVMLWLIGETLDGNITLGVLAMYYFAFTQGQKIMKVLFSNISELYKNLTFLENLFEFLSIENENSKVDEVLESKEDYKIVVDNISFKYPNSNRYALKNVSLTLNPSQITAIVGTNGSGKSTLIKLLNRFYDVNEGKILINDKNINGIEAKSLRENITVLFQNFIRYHLKVEDNIFLGNTKIQKDKSLFLKEAAISSGIDEVIKKLPDEYETLLGRWFGGVELSGGEWQKIALSRAFFKNSKIIMLDEPTSALDSWAEAEWLEKFQDLCRNKTALIITHRFTTARYADIIHVMDHGEIIESGSHEELIKMNGSYASSWKNQIDEFNNTKENDL